jgi:hypothetical protein
VKVSFHRTKEPPFVDLRKARLDAQYRRRGRITALKTALLLVAWWGGSFLVEWVTWRLGWSADASVVAASGWFIAVPLTMVLWSESSPERPREKLRAFARELRSWIVFGLLALAGAVTVLLLLLGYFALMQLTYPWGWSSLPLMVIGSVVFLYLDERNKRS